MGDILDLETFTVLILQVTSFEWIAEASSDRRHSPKDPSNCALRLARATFGTITTLAAGISLVALWMPWTILDLQAREYGRMPAFIPVVPNRPTELSIARTTRTSVAVLRTFLSAKFQIHGHVINNYILWR